MFTNPMEMEIIKTGTGVEASWSRSVVKNNGETHEKWLWQVEQHEPGCGIRIGLTGLVGNEEGTFSRPLRGKQEQKDGMLN